MTISIADLEHAAAPSWRALEEERLGDWLLRAAGGFTGRANSALAAGDPGVPLTEAIDAVSRWYDARNLPAMVAVAYPTGQPECGARGRPRRDGPIPPGHGPQRGSQNLVPPAWLHRPS